MAATLGDGRFTYRVVPDWGDLPDGWELGEVAGVAVDAQDRVYVFNRGEHPVVVFERDGRFVGSWGEGYFDHPHGIHMAADQTVFCTDDGNHTVSRHTLDGTLLLELGTRGRPSPFHSGQPFNRCTHTALSPEGDIYVTDGYGNARVHRYSPDGRLIRSWGRSGTGPGEFNLPHNVVCDSDGWVYVADRENHRIQVFDGDGVFQTQWGNLHRPCALHLVGGPDSVLVVGEIGPTWRFNRGAPNLGPRLSVLTVGGDLVCRLESEPAAGLGPGQFLSPHGLATDSHGDLYVGEVSVTAWPQLFPDRPMPRPIRSLQKLVRV